MLYAKARYKEPSKKKIYQILWKSDEFVTNSELCKQAFQ